MTPAAPDVAARLEAVRERVAAAAQRAGRAPESVGLLGASKVQSAQTVAAALRHGLGGLGENYVQEAAEKRPRIEALAREQGFPLPRWHLIGALQRNKARRAVALFDVIESVDRPSLADALARAASASEVRAEQPLEIFLQVNLSAEPQKAGVAESDLVALYDHCQSQKELSVVGLMTIPAPAPNPEDNRAVFARLRAWRERLSERPGGSTLRELSMGMSRDFEIAIEEGATVVRVGSDLFGPRPAKSPVDRAT